MPASSRTSTFVLGVVAAAALGAFFTWPRAAGRPPALLSAASVSAVSIGPARSASTCPALRDAPAARPLDGPAPDCPIVDDVKAALKKDDASLTEPDLVKLRTSVEQAVAEHPSACISALAPVLEQATGCGIAFDAVAIRIINGKAVSPAMAAGALLRPSACQWKLVSALREAALADPTIVATVASLTTSADEDVRGASWLTLGTLGRLARDNQQSEIVNCIDETIATKLSNRADKERFIHVRAAGNAGCERCRASLVEDLSSTDADVRRETIASFRFLSTKADVALICSVLTKDKQAEVRESAAFALRQRDTFVEDRLGCLFEAATKDASTSVASTTVLSIHELAAHSRVAVGTLVQVAKHARHAQVRKQAGSALRSFASEDAIRKTLSTR
jgi:hypothetical protein